MVELILVIVIIGIIALLSQSTFKLKNRERTLSQACASSLYWEIRNFFDKVQNNKWIISWWNIFFPEEYIVNITPTNQEISLGFIKTGSTIISQKFSLSGKNLRKINYCNQWNYSLKLSWENIQLILQKQFINTIVKPAFLISWSINSITWKTIFEWCSPENEFCKEIFFRQRDKRLHKIDWFSCQSNQPTGECFNRTKQ